MASVFSKASLRKCLSPFIEIHQQPRTVISSFGLAEACKGVKMLITQSSPVRQFYQSRSMLTLEEAGLAKQVLPRIQSAMLRTDPTGPRDGNNGGFSPVTANRGKKKSGGKKGGRNYNGNNTKNGYNSGALGPSSNSMQCTTSIMAVYAASVVAISTSWGGCHHNSRQFHHVSTLVGLSFWF
ncbi:hypothetical protein OROMI_009667 [Orobanche minor]